MSRRHLRRPARTRRTRGGSARTRGWRLRGRPRRGQRSDGRRRQHGSATTASGRRHARPPSLTEKIAPRRAASISWSKASVRRSVAASRSVTSSSVVRSLRSWRGVQPYSAAANSTAARNHWPGSRRSPASRTRCRLKGLRPGRPPAPPRQAHLGRPVADLLAGREDAGLVVRDQRVEQLLGVHLEDGGHAREVVARRRTRARRRSDASRSRFHASSGPIGRTGRTYYRPHRTTRMRSAKMSSAERSGTRRATVSRPSVTTPR